MDQFSLKSKTIDCNAISELSRFVICTNLFCILMSIVTKCWKTCREGLNTCLLDFYILGIFKPSSILISTSVWKDVSCLHTSDFVEICGGHFTKFFRNIFFYPKTRTLKTFRTKAVLVFEKRMDWNSSTFHNEMAYTQWKKLELCEQKTSHHMGHLSGKNLINQKKLFITNHMENNHAEN